MEVKATSPNQEPALHD